VRRNLMYKLYRGLVQTAPCGAQRQPRVGPLLGVRLGPQGAEAMASRDHHLLTFLGQLLHTVLRSIVARSLASLTKVN